MSKDEKKSLAAYRRKCKTAAKDLFYPVSVVEAIRKAKSESELARIMIDARRAGIIVTEV